ncbi:MAG TPA: serine--tRNA ligase [Chloroflexota bacterium]|jgi:seryl-tRNA synthetase|nr:serine--tRNA ligase [Chloroflexota bacterium]
MLNPDLLRRDPDKTRAALARRGEDAIEAFNKAVEADDAWRRETAEVEQLRADRRQRAASRRGRPSDEEVTEERRLGEALAAREQELKELEQQRQEAMSWVPNLPDESVPAGKDDTENELLRVWGEPKSFDFEPLPHWDLAERLGILDLQAGATLAGARFFVLKGAGAMLQRALINFMLDLHVGEQGYTEMHTPYMVREEIMYGSGQLPKFYDNLYHDAEEDLWLIPTSEVPLVNMYWNQIIGPGELPLKMTAQSPCFRKERAAAGRDVRGIKRVKQFYKVEMVRVVEPESSMTHLEELVSDAESVLRALELPYQVLALCTGDLGFAMTKTYDLNAWAAGSGEWLEVSSISNANDYQSRRANIRFRREAGGKTEYPHTLNGSGVAVPRTLIAILENNQQEDGSVVIPAVLRPYMRGMERITAPGK